MCTFMATVLLMVINMPEKPRNNVGNLETTQKSIWVDRGDGCWAKCSCGGSQQPSFQLLLKAQGLVLFVANSYLLFQFVCVTNKV